MRLRQQWWLVLPEEGSEGSTGTPITVQHMEDMMNRRMGTSLCVIATAAMFSISMDVERPPGSQIPQLVAKVLAANEDTPTGGGYGCKSNGNCQGTLYTDKRNLDRWWYPICSGCHTPQASSPAIPPPALSLAQRKFVGDAKAFWDLHAQAQPDPALRALLPKSRLRPLQTLSPEFRALVKK